MFMTTQNKFQRSGWLHNKTTRCDRERTAHQFCLATSRLRIRVLRTRSDRISWRCRSVSDQPPTAGRLGGGERVPGTRFATNDVGRTLQGLWPAGGAGVLPVGG